jgi:hypothetical protein
MFDFPSSPSVGQIFTTADVSYVYNGTGWTVQGGTASNFVLKAGDTMLGALQLPAANPTAATQAAHKGYVDGQVSAVSVAKADKTYVDSQDALKADKTYVDSQNASQDIAVSAKVAKAGDTMTGDLAISKASPLFALNATSASPGIYLNKSGGGRWVLFYADAESGGNTGSNLYLGCYNDAGTSLLAGYPISIQRSTGSVNMSGALSVSGSIASGGALTAGGSIVSSGAISSIQSANVGTYHFGNSGSKYLYYDGTSFKLNGGPIAVADPTLYVGHAGALGTVQFGNTNTKYLTYDGTSFNLAGGGFSVLAGDIRAVRTPSEGVYFFGSSSKYIHFNGTSFQLVGGDFVISGKGYQPGGGVWLDSSDARIKNVLGNYDNGLDSILTLNPVRYTFKGNDTTAEPSSKAIHDPGAPEDKGAVVAPYANSPHHDAATKGTEFIGLIAQDVEAVFPEMVTKREGQIDGNPVTDLRDLNTTALVFALVNAVKTLNARIEALEAR